MLREIIRKLSSVGFTDNPFISLYLDLSFDTIGRRNYQQFFRKRVNELDVIIRRDRDKYDSFKRDLYKIEKFLNYEIGENAMGVSVFACSADNVFETVILPEPFTNQMVVSGVPALSQLVLKAKLGEPLAVIVGDTQSAIVYFSLYGRLVGQEVFFKVEDEQVKIRRFTSKVFERGGKSYGFGGDSNKLESYEEELFRTFVKEVSENLNRWRIEKRYKFLLLFGNVVFITLLDRYLHPEVRKMLIDKTKVDPDSPESEILKLTKQLYTSFLKERELDLQKRIINEVLSDGLAVVGIEPTIEALTLGQVGMLVLSKELNEMSYRCVGCSFLTVSGEPKRCPICSSKIVKEDLKESLVYLAGKMDADINIIEPIGEIRDYGGVGAILRYK
ncbi:MAG: hypothetical protein ACUVWP_03680 [bacterium]